MRTDIHVLLLAATLFPSVLCAPPSAWLSTPNIPFNASAANSLGCNTEGLGDRKVLRLEIGKYTRCMTVTTPADAIEPMPILFWFHGAGDTSRTEACTDLSVLASKYKFVLVCAEALQNISGFGGQWMWPEVNTASTGTRCLDTDSTDMPYIRQSLTFLGAEPQIYDTSRLFFAGCSMGSQFALYISICMKEQSPESVSAFATHSSGLKVKGDGLKFPLDIYNHSYTWGECPECQYIPAVPRTFSDELGLKACIFDNTGDYPEFFWSSAHLAFIWEKNNLTTEVHMDDAGGHCLIPSFMEILDCLDDDTGRLLQREDALNASQLDSFLAKPYVPLGAALQAGRRHGLRGARKRY